MARFGDESLTAFQFQSDAVVTKLYNRMSSSLEAEDYAD